MELQRLGDRVVHGRRVRADLLELPDVGVPRLGGRRERPVALDERAPHVQEPGADRRQQPLVQAGAVVVALEIGQREREVRERMRAIDDRLDAARPGHSTDVAHGEDLPGEIGDVADVDHLRPRRHRLFKPAKQVALIGRRYGKRDLLQDDAVAAHALLPRVEHPPVVLICRQDFVAGFQVDAQLRDLQRLARVPRDRQFLGVAAELGGEPTPDGLEIRLEHLPHVVHRRLVRDVEVPLHRLVHHTWARADAAVVQIGDGAIEREGLADLAPEVLVLCHILGRPAGRGSGGLLDACQQVWPTQRRDRRGRAQRLEERAARGGSHARIVALDGVGRVSRSTC